jgi:hypothetical protein
MCIGLVHKFVRFLMLTNNLFFTQIIKQSINYVFSTAPQRLGRFSIPCFKKSSGLAMKKSTIQFWSSLSLKETEQIVGERAKEVEI